MKKKIFIIFFIFLILISFVNIKNVYAFERQNMYLGVTWDDISSKGRTFISKGSATEKITEQKAKDELIPIGQLLMGVANAVVFVSIAILAIRWITASPAQQGKLKQQLIGYCVSVLVIYGAVGIWNFVRGLLET